MNFQQRPTCVAGYWGLGRPWGGGLCLICLSLLVVESSLAQTADLEQTPAHSSYSTDDLFELREKSTAKIKGLPASNATEVTPVGIDTTRIKQINDRIKLLKSFIDQENKIAAEQAKQAEQARQAERRQRPLGSAATAVDKPLQPPVPAGPNQPTPPEEFVPSIDPDAQVADVPAKQVVTEPVNTLELGYSLFMTGNYSAANHNFQTLLAQKLSPDEKSWVHCLLGSGYRIQREFSKAEKMYRKAGSDKQASPFTAKYANWGLRYIENRRDAIQRMGVVSTELDKLTEEIKDVKNE